jgi:putative oxidoreductase
VPIPGVLVPIAGLLALFGGLSVLFGFKARWGAVLLVVFLVPVTLMMHDFWSVTDPMLKQMQLAMFLKNVSLIGGALFFAAHGAGAYSLDARSEARLTPAIA